MTKMLYKERDASEELETMWATVSIQEVRKRDFLPTRKPVLSESQETNYMDLLASPYCKRKEKEEDICIKTSSIKCVLGVGKLKACNLSLHIGE